MRTRPLLTIGSLLGLVVCVTVCPTDVHIPSALARSPGGDGHRGRKIEQALDLPCDVNFVDVPLIQALEYLGESMHIPILIDAKALNAEGLSVKTTVTLQVKGVAIRNVLNLLLEPLLLAYVVEDRTLNVTTQTVAEEKYYTRTYSVVELIEPQAIDQPHNAYRFLVNAIRSVTGGKWEIENNALDQTPLQSDAEPENADLQSNGVVAGTIQVRSDVGTLEIRQTQKVHRKIQELLTGIKKAKRYTGNRASGQIQTPSN